MPTEVTDPAILAQLNGTPQGGSGQEVTDPAILAQLNGAPAPTAPPETVGRVAGLTGRSLAQGVADVEDAPSNIGHAIDGAAVWLLKRAGAVSPDYQLPDPAQAVAQFKQAHPTLAAIASHTPTIFSNPFNAPAAAGAQATADAAGLPTAATPGERIYSKAVEAVPSAIFAPETPIAGALSATAGGAASQATAEAGGGPVAQTIAGLAAGGLPAIGAGAAGLTRTLTRGAGEDAAAATQARIDAAAGKGVSTTVTGGAPAPAVPLTAGQATGSRLLQQVEGSSSKLWGGGPIKATADTQAEALGSQVDHIVNNLAPGADVSPTGAGEAINTGVAAAKGSMKAAEGAAYDKVDQLVPATTPVDVSGTLSRLEGLATPTPGAANTTGALIPPKIAALQKNLQADLTANGGTTIPYSAARALRTAVGNSIDWGFAPSDPVTNGALKQVYGALGDDVNAGASAISPEAKQAVTDASALYAANSQKRDLLNSIVDKAGGPEAVFQAATNGTKNGATKIAGVMGAIDPQSQNVVRATVLDRLGRAVPSQQNAAGSVFNPETFLTNWAKMSPQAKDAIFGASGAPNSLRAGLDSLEGTVSAIRNSTIYKNPSGTASALGHGAGLAGILGGLGEAVISGHPHALIGVGASIAGNAILSRALTNPRTVAWLAQTTKMPTAALPNAINQLANMGRATNDPDARDLAAYLQQRQ